MSGRRNCPEKYAEYRKRNNEASKVSRKRKQEHYDEIARQKIALEETNRELHQQIESLQAELCRTQTALNIIMQNYEILKRVNSQLLGGNYRILQKDVYLS